MLFAGTFFALARLRRPRSLLRSAARNTAAAPERAPSWIRRPPLSLSRLPVRQKEIGKVRAATAALSL